MDIKEIKAVFAEYGVPMQADDAWKVQQTWVIKHKALERLSGKLGLQFDSPVMMQDNAEGRAMLVRGYRKIGEDLISEWSIGEVNPSNYRTSGKQPSYAWAMLEKRAKDRVILKLAGLHGAYSEDEADDFSDENKKEYPPAEAPAERPARPSRSNAAKASAAGDNVVPIKPAAKASSNMVSVGESQDSDTVPVDEPTQEEIDEAASIQTDADGVIQEEAPAGESTEPTLSLADRIKARIDAIESIDAVTDLMLHSATQSALKEMGDDQAKAVKKYAAERLKALGWPGGNKRRDEGAKAAS